MFVEAFIGGVLGAGTVAFFLNFKEEERYFDPADTYFEEKKYYREHGEFPSYVYEVMSASGCTEEEVKKIMGITD